jgi:hypothetical protein
MTTIERRSTQPAALSHCRVMFIQNVGNLEARHRNWLRSLRFRRSWLSLT